MKKLAIASVLMFLLAGCANDSAKDPLPTTSQTDVISEKLEASSLVGLEVASYNIGASTNWDTIEAIKMTTTEASDSVAITIANTVNEYIANRIDDFQKDVKSNKKTKYNSKFVNEFYLVYDESTVSKNIYAITISDDSYRGMAHNTSRTETFAFDKRTGEKIILRDQIEPSKIQAFDEFVAKTLEVQNSSRIFSEKEILQTLANSDQYFAWFASKQEGLALIFQEYAVGPYSSGQIAIGVGWEEVKEFFRPDSILLSEFAN